MLHSAQTAGAAQACERLQSGGFKTFVVEPSAKARKANFSSFFRMSSLSLLLPCYNKVLVLGFRQTASELTTNPSLVNISLLP